MKSLVERCGKAVGWQRLSYRMRLLSVPEGVARRICQPLRRGFLQKTGLPPGTAAAAADSFVWMVEQDELAAERVLMLMRLLGGGGVPARAVGGAVRELQRYVGCAEPISETTHIVRRRNGPATLAARMLSRAAHARRSARARVAGMAPG